MKIFENKDTSYEFDFCIINNNNRVVMFKFANSKRIKKDIKEIFNTNSELIITKRLEKYGLKLELVVQRPCYTLYNIVCINSLFLFSLQLFSISCHFPMYLRSKQNCTTIPLHIVFIGETKPISL